MFKLENTISNSIQDRPLSNQSSTLMRSNKNVGLPQQNLEKPPKQLFGIQAHFISPGGIPMNCGTFHSTFVLGGNSIHINILFYSRSFVYRHQLYYDTLGRKSSIVSTKFKKIQCSQSCSFKIGIANDFFFQTLMIG